MLKSFKIIIVAPTCFGLHNHHQEAFSLCFTKVTMLTSVTYLYLKLSVLWLHNKYAATIPMTSNNDICNRSQHCNFKEAQDERSLMMVYVNRNMLEQLL